MNSKCNINKVDRSVSTISRLDSLQSNKSKYSPSELMGFVWDLTVEVYSLNGKFDAEQRLQRNVTNLIRK